MRIPPRVLPLPHTPDAPRARRLEIVVGGTGPRTDGGARPKGAMTSAGAMAIDKDQPTEASLAGASLAGGPGVAAASAGAPGSGGQKAGAMKDVPIDWEALEDAFENNAPEVHSYLHLGTGDVLRVVDGVADPQMHARIASDANYLRIDPVSSREQYRWMERYIPMVEDPDLQGKLTQAIDGKGAFRRFKDVLMSYGPERERWFSFRSERLRIFMEAWLNAHALTPVARPAWAPDAAPSHPGAEPAAPRAEEPAKEPRRGRSAESLRKAVREIADALGPRDLDTLVAFAEFLKARRAARSFAQQADGNVEREGASAGAPSDDDAPASQDRPGADVAPRLVPPS